MQQTESDRREPLSGNAATNQLRDLSETLDTNHLDIAQEDDSVLARLTRKIAALVGVICTPRKMLIILRLLKAITFAFLGLTIVADLMYIFFVEVLASNEVNTKVGGTRDAIIRIYGLLLTFMAIAVEMDVVSLVQFFPGLKGFIARAFLLFFVATITSASPLHERTSGGDGAYYGDNYTDANVTSEIPNSTVMFQRVTSFVIGCCAICYLVLGLMCFDRFTSKAFLSKSNPIESTAIPPSNGIQMQSHGSSYELT